MEDGIVVIVVGLVLCFFGVRSLHLALLASGFGACWLIAQAFGAEWTTALAVAVGGALVIWLLVTLVFRAGMFVLGAIVGAAVGAKLYTLLDDGDTSWILAGIVVIAVAVATGVLANRLRERFLIWATALGGAGLARNGLARAVPSLDELWRPTDGAETTVATVAWIALAIGGVLVQRQFVKEP